MHCVYKSISKKVYLFTKWLR